DAARDAELQDVCTLYLNAFRLLTVYLKPVLPEIAKNVESFFGAGELTWASASEPLLGRAIQPYQNLINRAEATSVAAMVNESKEDMKAMGTPAPAAAAGSTITLDDFSKIELRIAKIENAEPVEGADKLLRLTLD